MTDSYSGSSTDTCSSAEAGLVEDRGATEIEDFLEHIDRIDRDSRWSARFETSHAALQDEEAGFIAPLVFELGDIRSLLANWAYVQSAMSITDPYRLMLEYTQAMMGFLLFNPSPKTIEIIGLGGGSLAKYCHKFVPESAYSDEVGRVYRSEVGHRADVKRATCTDPKRAILGAPAWVV